MTTTVDGVSYSYTDLCARTSGVCQKATILAFYNYNRTHIAALSDAELWTTIVDANFVATEQDGREVPFSSVASYGTTTGIVFSTRMQVVMAQRVDTDGNNKDRRAWTWAIEVMRFIHDSVIFN